MQTTAKYNLNIVEGNDIVNPLVQFNPNFQKIDETMYNNEISSVGTATEIKSGSVHAITRVNTEVTTFKFVATSDYVAGETFTLDGEQVTAYTTDGSPLATNAYRIGAVVLVSVSGTVMYFYTAAVGTTTAENAEKLNGQPAEYYRTAEALNAVRDTATSAGLIASQAATKEYVNSRTVGYSLDEQNTGLSWIDGKPIYKKTFYKQNISGQWWFDIATLTDTTKILNVEIISNESAGPDTWENGAYTRTNGNMWRFNLKTKSFNVSAKETATTVYEMFVTVYYIK